LIQPDLSASRAESSPKLVVEETFTAVACVDSLHEGVKVATLEAKDGAF